MNKPIDPNPKDFQDPFYKHQWHMAQINLPQAFARVQGHGAVVAVIDTGVAYEDYDRFKRVRDLNETQFVHPYDFVDNDAHANDDHGHGTHVAGTIAQSTNNGLGVVGVAPGATIMPLRVLDGSGRGSLGAIANAIKWAADKGAHVVNMSLGGPFPSSILRKACKYAVDKGVLLVCAAGNSGEGLDIRLSTQSVWLLVPYSMMNQLLFIPVVVKKFRLQLLGVMLGLIRMEMAILMEFCRIVSMRKIMPRTITCYLWEPQWQHRMLLERQHYWFRQG